EIMSQLITKWRYFTAGIARHIEVWRTAWQEQKRQEPVTVPKGRELEFLPAVLEIQDSPPSPIGRAIIFSIIGVFTAALIWSIFGHIDIVAVAQGKIIPSDYSKVIQPLESGIIKKIHVRDGQHVKKGDVLIELDATTTGADRERFLNEYLAAQTEIARLRALITDQNNFQAPKGANPVFVKIQRDRLRDQLAEFRALQHQAEAYKSLYDKQLVSKMQYLEAERARAQKAQEHAAALAEAETRAYSLSQELAKAENRTSQQTLTAPIDGVVQQLAVHTVGGVVTPAQQLLVIAPREGLLEVEAWVDNKDIGFVNPEQEVEIKVEAFPFTRYGTIEGKILTLSKDAVPVEKVGLVYAARVSMSRSTIRVENDKDVYLSPGMNVSVEIKTGQRRLIEYFLSPLLQASRESIRER
ncbi:MAG: HlyD family type I secretion periplasmic adaptor subunit, partial [Sulfuricaulis sp.]|nr:HlyD family type I secretion periplasmic adaptor subunit [Sulfuricaulis sp.]